MRNLIAFAVVAVLPALASAQIKAPTGISVPTATATVKLLTGSDIAPTTGTSIAPSASYLGITCGTQPCLVARAAAGAQPAVSMKLAAAGVDATEFRTGVIFAHDVPHSLTLSLNGADIFGLLCNGFIEATPRYGALGAANGFSWQVFDGSKLVKSGHSNGEAVNFGAVPMAMGSPMQIAISSKGAFEVVHGTIRILIAADDKAAIGAKTGGYLRFEDLGLRGGGVSEFAVVAPSLKFGVQPPGI